MTHTPPPPPPPPPHTQFSSKMTSSPLRSKAVSFNIPVSKTSSPRTLVQTPQTNSSLKPSSPLSSAPAPKPETSLLDPQSQRVSTPTAQHGAKPDLVADIIDAPKVANPRKPINHNSSVSRSDSRAGSDVRGTIESQQKRTSPSSGKRHAGGRVYCRSGTRMFANTTSTRDRSPLLDQHKYKALGMSNTQVAEMASQVRGATNASTHEHTRALKYDAARLREHLLRVEEEIKNMNRGRNTLELAIQDVRKALSVNQQSISTQQKKSSRGDEVYKTNVILFPLCRLRFFYGFTFSQYPTHTHLF